MYLDVLHIVANTLQKILHLENTGREGRQRCGPEMPAGQLFRNSLLVEKNHHNQIGNAATIAKYPNQIISKLLLEVVQPSRPRGGREGNGVGNGQIFFQFLSFFLVSKVRIYGRVDNDEIHFDSFVLFFKKQNEAQSRLISSNFWHMSSGNLTLH